MKEKELLIRSFSFPSSKKDLKYSLLELKKKKNQCEATNNKNSSILSC